MLLSNAAGKQIWTQVDVLSVGAKFESPTN